MHCRWFHHCALVLCPNTELCEQVVAAAEALNSSAAPSSEPLCTARVVTARSPPPLRSTTDVVVSTPAALCRLLDESGGAYGPQWDPFNFAQCIRHVVADEADALFTSDAYFKPLTRLLDVRRPCPAMHVWRRIL